MIVRPAIIPCLSYQDAPRAIDFLCDAFGFVRHAVYPSKDGSVIEHAQLTLDGNMIMLSSASHRGEKRKLRMVTPQELGGKVTSCIYVVVSDVDAHHARAAAAGAQIIDAPEDEAYSGRSYEARDLEGNVWSFGDYDPYVIFAGDEEADIDALLE